MPYVFVGKRNYFFGKRLWEIVGNLKNFGVGRILVRSKFERYPEVSYVRIIRAEPLMDDVSMISVAFSLVNVIFSLTCMWFTGKHVWKSVG